MLLMPCVFRACYARKGGQCRRAAGHSFGNNQIGHLVLPFELARGACLVHAVNKTLLQYVVVRKDTQQPVV